MKAIIIDSSALPGVLYTREKKLFDENGIEFVVYDCHCEAEVIEACRTADAVLDIYTKLTPKIINTMENCKVIVRYGIGYDMIDTDAAARKGIIVCNIPDYCIPEVACHTITLMLTALRKITLLDNVIKQKGIWNPNAGYSIHRLDTLTLGFVGFGNIARQTANYAKVYGFTMVAYDPYLPQNMFHEAGVKSVSLDELYKLSDVISLHVPLNNATKHMINKDSFEKMKDGVILVNTSRGPLICEEDMIEALKSGKVKAAGLDVVEYEPFTDTAHPYCQMNNVVLTPHSAFNSIESFNELKDKVALSAISVLKGKIPYNAVNIKI